MGNIPDPVPDPNDLLTPSAVAAFLGCSTHLVRYYAKDGRLPMLRTTNGRRLFKRCDVEVFASKWGALHPGQRRVA